MGSPFWVNLGTLSSFKYDWLPVYGFAAIRDRDIAGYRDLPATSVHLRTSALEKLGLQAKLNYLKRITFDSPSKGYEASALSAAFRDYIDGHMWVNIRPALAYAASDAVRDFLELVKTNHLETLAELGQLRSVLTGADVVSVARRLNDAIIHLKFGRYADGAWDLAKLYADADLMLKFGWGPLSDSATEFLEEGSKIVERLHSAGTLGTRTLYGKFELELPEGIPGFNIGPARLLARAKMRVQFGTSDLLAGWIGLQTIGLFPPISGLWEVLPFSFVLDWFTNIGQRIRDVEDSFQLSFLTLNHACYSISLEVDASESLGWYGHDLVPLSGTSLALRYYSREVSTVYPELGDSIFDFRKAPGAPVGTASSLLFAVATR
jgi:hypothetical protein